MDCLFCQFAQADNNSHVYEDEKVVAFNDIYPQAPDHLLIVPKKHIATLNDTKKEDTELLGHMMIVATQLAKKFELDEAGYRLVMNCNHDGGQTVFHIHLHLLGGRVFHWPPG